MAIAVKKEVKTICYNLSNKSYVLLFYQIHVYRFGQGADVSTTDLHAVTTFRFLEPCSSPPTAPSPRNALWYTSTPAATRCQYTRSPSCFNVLLDGEGAVSFCCGAWLHVECVERSDEVGGEGRGRGEEGGKVRY